MALITCDGDSMTPTCTIVVNDRGLSLDVTVMGTREITQVYDCMVNGGPRDGSNREQGKAIASKIAEVVGTSTRRIKVGRDDE
jgi:hypothetical protein